MTEKEIHVLETKLNRVLSFLGNQIPKVSEDNFSSVKRDTVVWLKVVLDSSDKVEKCLIKSSKQADKSADGIELLALLQAKVSFGIRLIREATDEEHLALNMYHVRENLEPFTRILEGNLS